ncbi:MAG: hypothetical protein AAB549_02845 [Patescibacteria group bacterium]
MDPAYLALTGQESCLAALRHVVQSGGFGHALLFASYDDVATDAVASWCTARIVCTAKLSDPCGSCAGCTSVKRQDGLMLLQTTLGERPTYAVDDIRAIRSHLALRAGQSGRRVVRIDNVDRCTVAAANALLKILEEPSMDVTFILTTASSARVLPTIRSRTMLYRLQPVPRTTMERSLAASGVPTSIISTVIAVAPGQLGTAAALVASPDALASAQSADATAEKLVAQTTTGRFRTLATYLEGKQEAGVQRQQVRSLFAAFARRAATDQWVQQRLGRLLTGLIDLQSNSQPRLLLEAFVT